MSVEEDHDMADGAGAVGEHADGFPSTATVDFGWQDDRPVTGRRLKSEKKRKVKPGSFGECC